MNNTLNNISPKIYLFPIILYLSVKFDLLELQKSEFQEKLKYMTQIKRMWAGSVSNLDVPAILRHVLYFSGQDFAFYMYLIKKIFCFS